MPSSKVNTWKIFFGAVFIFAWTAAPLWAQLTPVATVSLNDDNGLTSGTLEAPGDLGYAVSLLNTTTTSLQEIQFDLPTGSSAITLGSVTGGLGAVTLLGPAEFSLGTGTGLAQPLLEGTTAAAVTSGTAGNGGSVLFSATGTDSNSDPSFTLSSGLTLGFLGGAGGNVNVPNNADTASVTAGAGGAVSTTFGTLALDPGSALSLAGGAGGAVTAGTTSGAATGINGNATTGNGGAVTVSTGSVNLSGSTLSLAGGTGGGVTVIDASSSGYGITGSATVGNGGAVTLSTGSVTLSNSALNLVGGAGSGVTVSCASGAVTGINGNATAGNGGAAGVSTGLVDLLGSMMNVAGGAGGGVMVEENPGIGIGGNATAGSGGAAGVSAGLMSLSGSTMNVVGAGGVGVGVLVENDPAIGIVGNVTAGNGGAAGVSMGSAGLSDSTLSVTGGAGGGVTADTTSGNGIGGNATAGNGGAAGVSAGSVTLLDSTLSVAGGAGGKVAVDVAGSAFGILVDARAGNGGNAGVSIGFLSMNALSTLDVLGGAGASVTAAASAGGGAILGSSTNGTAGSAFVTLGSLIGSGTVSLWGSTANLQVDSGVFSGVIAGNGSLNLAGGLVLDGVNTYTGPTTVLGGMLVVGDAYSPNAQVAGNVMVSTGALLGGFGTVAGIVTNNGMVSPGNGNTGTLTVGNYTQSAGATLGIGVTPAGGGTLAVQGTATLAGNLTVTATGNFGVKYTYQFLTTWNPLTTKFGTYGYDLPVGLIPSISYGSDDVELTLTRSNVDFGTFTQTANERAVAAALNSAVTSAAGDLLNKMNTLYTQASGQAGVLEQLGGVVYTALPNLTMESAQFQTGILMDRLEGQGLGTAASAMAWNPGPWADAASSDAGTPFKPKETKGYWLEQTDSFGSLSGNSEVAAFNQAAYGLIGGYESGSGDGLITGFAAGYLHTNLTSQGADGTAGVDNWQGDIYGKYAFESWDVAVVLGYGFNQYQVTRPIGTGIQAAGSFTGNQVSAGLQLEDHLNVQDLNPEILAGAEYTFVETGAFTERNADSYDLSVPEANAYSLRPYIGMGVEPKVKTGGLELEPSVRVTLAQEVLNQSAQQDISLAGAAESPFVITGVTPGQTIIGAQAGLGLKLDAHLKLYAAYDGTFSGTENLNTVAGGMNLGF